MAHRFPTWAVGRPELPFTKMGRMGEEPVWQEKSRPVKFEMPLRSPSGEVSR